MENKKDNTVDNIRFWALGAGMEETGEFTPENSTFKKDGFKITFIPESDKTRDELLECISKIKSDFIYVVTNDNSKRRELLKIIPDYCGILSFGDHFGLGFLSMVLKEPKQMKK